MSMMFQAGAERAAEEISKYLDQLITGPVPSGQTEYERMATIILLVKRKAEEIRQAAKAGWY